MCLSLSRFHPHIKWLQYHLFFSVHLMNVKALFPFYAPKWILLFQIGLAWASTFLRHSPVSSQWFCSNCLSLCNVRSNHDDLPSKSSAIFKTSSSSLVVMSWTNGYCYPAHHNYWRCFLFSCSLQIYMTLVDLNMLFESIILSNLNPC